MEKLYGWIVAKILDLSKTTITFYIQECEYKDGEPKFPQLLQQTIVYKRKKKIRNSGIVNEGQFPVRFIDSNSVFIPERDSEYALLINTTNFAPMEIWKAGSMADFCKALGRPYFPSSADVIYKVSIPVIQANVTDTLPKIISRLKQYFDGDPLVYLSDDKNTWFIKALDGEFKETTMPKLPEKVV